MGKQDCPAIIDFILEITGLEKISLIGHSAGATQIAAGASLIPDYYRKKVNVAFLLGPPLSVQNVNKFSYKHINLKFLEKFIDWTNGWYVFPYKN